MSLVYIFFLLLPVILVLNLRNQLQIQGHEDFSPLFSSKKFLVLDCNFMHVIHFQLLFVCGKR